MSISPRIATWLVVSNILSIGALVILFLTGSASPPTTFDVITAHRLNIVNEDGTQVIAIANKQKIAPPRVNGKPYPIAVADGRECMAGMIFFDEEGDEMGGLVFNSFRQPNGKIAGIGAPFLRPI